VNLQEAMEYNALRRSLGKFSDEHEAMLVAFLQEYAPEEIVSAVIGEENLQTDARFGPKSLSVLQEAFRRFARATPPPEANGSTVKPSTLTPFSKTLLMICEQEEGNGEEGWDNSGPHIVRYRGLPESYAKKNLGAWHHWCAFSAGYMVRQAYAALGRPADGNFMMFSDENFSGKKMPIGGARDLVRRAARSKHGTWVAREGKILEAIQPGDLVAIRYNSDTSEIRGAGHVFIVRTAEGQDGHVVTTWEGNLGPYPAKWKSRKRDLLKLGGSARLLQAARLS
jgi:hypothetical protein